jgi:hypothetical protein
VHGGLGVEDEAGFRGVAGAEAEAAVVEGEEVVAAVQGGEGVVVPGAEALGELGGVAVDCLRVGEKWVSGVWVGGG